MKKIINIALIAAAMTGAAVTAQAEVIEINLYGASAQRDYWNALAPEFLTDTMQCVGGVEKAQASSNYVVHKGSNCGANHDTIYINYGSVASMEGVLAALEVAPIDNKLNDTCGGNNALREIADSDLCDFVAHTCPMVCADITGGTSDVEMSSFVQVSKGKTFGHAGGDVKTFVADGSGYNVSALLDYKPTIVPFAFYANKNLGTNEPSGDLANLNRTQAVNIFAGKVATWDKLRGFENFGEAVQVCLRHAGSGTHATLDKVVFRDDTKSNLVNLASTDPAYGRPSIAPGNQMQALSLVREEKTTSAPYIYFYKSSSSTVSGEAGMKECIETNGGRSNALAIGYMDADTPNTNYMHQMLYQGTPAVDEEAKTYSMTNGYINSGSYDFWSAQNVYVKNDTTNNSPTMIALMAFADGKIPDNKYGIWTTKTDLQVTKAKDSHLPKN